MTHQNLLSKTPNKKRLHHCCQQIVCVHINSVRLIFAKCFFYKVHLTISIGIELNIYNHK